MNLRSGVIATRSEIKKKNSPSEIKKLKANYYNPKTPGSFSGAHSFYKSRNKRLTQKWLNSQDTYTLHKPVVQKFPRRKVICGGIFRQLEADLIDMKSLSRCNKGVKYLLTCIDCFSKKGFVRAQHNKKTQTTITALEHILKEIKTKVWTICSDEGSEFKSKAMSKFLAKKGIHIFSTKNKKLKSVIVERFNKSLQNKLYRYMSSRATKKYLDVLQDIVESYNATYHSSIGMAPKDVNIANSEYVWHSLYPPPVQRPRKPRFNIGSFVRIQKKAKLFRKGYLSGWEPEIYTVVKVLKTTPYTYQLANENGNKIKKNYYGRELALITNYK